MKKNLLSLIVAVIIVGQSAQATDVHKNPVARALCDIAALVLPTYTWGTESYIPELDANQKPKEGVLEADDSKINSGNFVPGANGLRFVKTADNKYQLADASTPHEKKAVFMLLESANVHREKLINKASQEYHFLLSQKIFEIKSIWFVERLYALGFSGVTIYVIVKIVQKIYDAYADAEEQREGAFDKLSEEVENLAQKMKTIVQEVPVQAEQAQIEQ